MDNNKPEYPDLDFTPILGDGIYVVHCTTAEDAEHFLAAMKRQHPSRCKNWNGTKFGKYDDGICYRPNLNMPEGYNMRHCNLGYYQEEGYEIIPFEDLVIHPDIEESEQSVDLLFGGVA